MHVQLFPDSCLEILPIIPGAGVKLALKLLVAPVAVVRQECLHVQTPCVLGDLRSKTIMMPAPRLAKWCLYCQH